jgi:hypothetical protein
VKARDEVRTRHDEWTKRALSLWLAELGEVTLDVRIAGQSRRGDVLYTERRDRPAHRRRLGLLGHLARGEVLFEPFRNPPTPLELKGCVLKAIDLEAREIRAARRGQRKLSSVVGLVLCVITPSMSAAYARHMGIKPLGSEKRDATLTLLIAWRQSLPPPAEQSEDERELTMNLDQIYERWEKKTLARGKAEGKAEAVLAVLAARGLAVSPAQRKQVLACADTAILDRWLRAAVTVPSVKALLADGGPVRPRARRA